MEKEIYDIPVQARLCFERNKGLISPDKVPYLGMGASYFAAVTLRYLGVKIFPEIAGDYFNYLRSTKHFDHAVLISQSGRTTDVLNCTTCFSEYTAIVNDIESPLANGRNIKSLIPIVAGSEKLFSTKTYINTLIVLYLGHGFDVRDALESMERRYSEFELIGTSIGTVILKSIKKEKLKCIIIGNGPNVGTACQAAHILSESTKYPFIGMSLTQYEHGYKETAKGTLVIVINPTKGILYERSNNLMNTLRNADAMVYEINDTELDETYSPITSILPFFFMAGFLASRLGISKPYLVGKKITEITDSSASIAE